MQTRIFNFKTTLFLLLSSVFPLLPGITQTTTVWTGAGDGSDWFDNANWDNGIPGVDDSAVLNAGADVVLSAPSAELASFEMTDGTLLFTNWTTKLTAVEITISGGTTTVADAFVDFAMSNRVWFACENFTLGANAKINVDGKGYAGDGNGPGGGGGQEGGSYGAQAYTSSGLPYGTVEGPVYPGSGGGPASGGGGAVYIEATATLVLNGEISAKGVNGGGHNGGGSGGGVFLSADTFSGTGSIYADGANGSGAGKPGSGGRIAVHYNTANQEQVSPRPNMAFSVKGGLREDRPVYLYMGSLYFSGNHFIKPVINDISGHIYFEGTTLLGMDSMLISDNMHVTFPTNFVLTITNNLTITDASGLSYSFPDYIPDTLSIGGDLILTNTAEFHLYAGATSNDHEFFHGGLLNLSGRDIIVPTNCVIYPHSHPTNGGSIKIAVKNLTVENGGAINANGSGYMGGWSGIDYVGAGFGPGAGEGDRTGGGYGGDGNGSSGGLAYGTATGPIYPGSGGSAGVGRGGSGGGLVFIEAVENIILNGKLSADGSIGGAHTPGGSGGGIFLVCEKLSGNGLLSVKGGPSSGAGLRGGGGGRIAIWTKFTGPVYDAVWTGNIPGQVDVYTNTLPQNFTGLFGESVFLNGGQGSTEADSGEPGTYRWLHYVWSGSIFSAF